MAGGGLRVMAGATHRLIDVETCGRVEMVRCGRVVGKIEQKT